MISCPECGEADVLVGTRASDGVEVVCASCGHRWLRGGAKRCPTCGADLRTVPLAILEKSRGTQLSMVGTRPVDLCPACDADDLARWHRNRPNPLMPKDIPTA